MLGSVTSLNLKGEYNMIHLIWFNENRNSVKVVYSTFFTRPPSPFTTVAPCWHLVSFCVTVMLTVGQHLFSLVLFDEASTWDIDIWSIRALGSSFFVFPNCPYQFGYVFFQWAFYPNRGTDLAVYDLSPWPWKPIRPWQIQPGRITSGDFLHHLTPMRRCNLLAIRQDVLEGHYFSPCHDWGPTLPHYRYTNSDRPKWTLAMFGHTFRSAVRPFGTTRWRGQTRIARVFCLLASLWTSAILPWSCARLFTDSRRPESCFGPSQNTSRCQPSWFCTRTPVEDVALSHLYGDVALSHLFGMVMIRRVSQLETWVETDNDCCEWDRLETWMPILGIACWISNVLPHVTKRGWTWCPLLRLCLHMLFCFVMPPHVFICLVYVARYIPLYWF